MGHWTARRQFFKTFRCQKETHTLTIGKKWQPPKFQTVWWALLRGLALSFSYQLPRRCWLSGRAYSANFSFVVDLRSRPNRLTKACHTHSIRIQLRKILFFHLRRTHCRELSQDLKPVASYQVRLLHSCSYCYHFLRMVTRCYWSRANWSVCRWASAKCVRAGPPERGSKLRSLRQLARLLYLPGSWEAVPNLSSLKY